MPHGQFLADHFQVFAIPLDRFGRVDVEQGATFGLPTIAVRAEHGRCSAQVADRFNAFGPEWTSRECRVQYRYRSPAVPALVEREADGRVRVTLHEPGYCVAPGQSAVFYDGDRLIGGARIREVL